MIEKLLIFKEHTIEFIVELILENFLDFSHNPNSLCLTKKLILNAENKQARSSACSLVVANVLDLMNSQYGNYLVQTALEVILFI